MKVKLLTIKLFSVLIFSSPCFAGDLPPGIPSSGEIVIERGEEAPDFVVSGINSNENSVAIKVPIVRSQYIAETIKNPEWQIYASLAYTDGKKWFLITEKSYKIETKLAKEEYIPAKVYCPSKGEGWFWVRVWGRDLVSKNWLWINTASKYMRKAKNGNAGYEFFVNPGQRKSSIVPDEYSLRY